MCLPALWCLTCESPSTPEDKALFRLLDAAEAGLRFENNLTYTEAFNVYLYRSFYNGAGVGMADFNKDGNLDLFFCGNQADNALYLGDGDFHFRDVTQAAGVRSPNAWSTGVSIVDINQDGWLDIYVCKGGDPRDENRRNELFIHQGLNADGVPYFVEAAAQYGIDDLGFSIHACFFDYDRDGDLDMYLSNNSIKPTDVIFDAKKGLREQRDPGGGNKLYRNDDQFFTDVSQEAGIYSSAIGFGLGVSVADVNRDNWPDIYVANDFFEKDYLYINQQDGTFRESIDECVPELSLGSMGVDIADMNHDGYPEIFVTEMLPETEARLKTKAVFDTWDQYALKVRNGYHRQFPRNAFQLNRGSAGDGRVSFSEISRLAGVSATDWSWGVHLVDFDQDGYREIFVTNGIVKDLLDQDYIDFYYDPSRVREMLRTKGAVIKDLIDHMPSEPAPNYLFSPVAPLRYEDVAARWGLGQPGFSSGASYGDIDNDGDLDLVVSNINGPPFLYRNELDGAENHFVNLKIYNRDGATGSIGAQVTLYAGGRQYFQELYPMRGSMSTVDDRLHIGIGEAAQVDSLLIRWPDGAQLRETNIPADQFLTFTQPPGGGAAPLFVARQARAPLLSSRDHFPGLDFVHRENDFVDFDRERLLFHMRSNEGPRVAVGDVNGDRLDDFFVGGAKGAPGALFIQEGEGFRRSNAAVFEANRQSEDIDAVFFDADNDQDLDLAVAGGGYEFSPNDFALADRLYLNDGRGNFQLAEQALPAYKLTATAVIAPADVDQDGDQDLFLGGRMVPTRFGLPAPSFLLENDGNGKFKDVTREKAPALERLGLVTDALWLDLDQDQDEDLIVAGEWMPVRVFENTANGLVEITGEMGLDATDGFWNVLEKADLDGDGDEDLIAGNLGENTFFQAGPERPALLYVNDFDGNGRIEQIIATHRGGEAYPLCLKKELTKQLPHLLKKYLKHADYAEERVQDIFSAEALERAIVHRVVQTRSGIFWNEQGRFTFRPFPLEAQLAPVYGIQVIDADGDRQPDILLGGNQFKAKPQTGIYAAGRGLLLRNAGQRQFTPLTAAVSGVDIPGQVRDFAALTIGNRRYVLAARNDASLIFYQLP